MKKFNPRYTEPSDDNPYYISQDCGGYNPCIVIDGASCLPNCVGYANGRSREISDNQCNMPACNACGFLSNTDLETGTEPRLGAVIVWGGGYGHVGVIEAIDGDTITVSQSNYGGTRFFLTQHNVNDLDIVNHAFMGFIYNPYVEDSEIVNPVYNGVFRLYNFNSGEHFYTANIDEANNLVSLGWQYEGVSFMHAGTDGVPCYRLYNPSGDHFFTTDTAERDGLLPLGWQDEGTCFNVMQSGSPVYRLYNPNASVGTHIFTSSADERDYLQSIGWTDEGIGWYAK